LTFTRCSTKTASGASNTAISEAETAFPPHLAIQSPPAWDSLLSVATIWLAHIRIDRSLGYGLKYSAGFAFTHLGRIGKVATT
jgi:hypothetical protein